MSPAPRRCFDLALSHCIDSLRCSLCRNGLLAQYGVYSRPTDRFGVPGQPLLSATATGFFYSKNTRHFPDILEIAGNIGSGRRYDFRLLEFGCVASDHSLILIDGSFFRVAQIRVISPSCRILDLEADCSET